MKRDEIFERAKLPSLAKEGWLRHQKNCSLPLKARPGWFVQQPIIGGLNQPPRLRPLRRLRGILLMGAAFLDASPYRARASRPPLPRRGAWLAQKSRLSFQEPHDDEHSAQQNPSRIRAHVT